MPGQISNLFLFYQLDQPVPDVEQEEAQGHNHYAAKEVGEHAFIHDPDTANSQPILVPLDMFRVVFLRAIGWIDEEVQSVFQWPDQHQRGNSPDFQQPNRSSPVEAKIDQQMSYEKLQHINHPMVNRKVLAAEDSIDVKEVKIPRPSGVINQLIGIFAKDLMVHLPFLGIPDIFAGRQFLGPAVFPFNLRF